MLAYGRIRQSVTALVPEWIDIFDKGSIAFCQIMNGKPIWHHLNWPNIKIYEIVLSERAAIWKGLKVSLFGGNIFFLIVSKNSYVWKVSVVAIS